MRLVYSRQALADIDENPTYYSTNASSAIAPSLQSRLGDVFDPIFRLPAPAPRVLQRSQVRVVAVVRYPFRIFYRVRDDTIDILHIRHTSRRPLPTDLE